MRPGDRGPDRPTGAPRVVRVEVVGVEGVLKGCDLPLDGVGGVGGGDRLGVALVGEKKQRGLAVRGAGSGAQDAVKALAGVLVVAGPGANPFGPLRLLPVASVEGERVEHCALVVVGGALHIVGGLAQTTPVVPPPLHRRDAHRPLRRVGSGQHQHRGDRDTDHDDGDDEQRHTSIVADGVSSRYTQSPAPARAQGA